MGFVSPAYKWVEELSSAKTDWKYVLNKLAFSDGSLYSEWPSFKISGTALVFVLSRKKDQNLLGLFWTLSPKSSTKRSCLYLI